MSFYSGETNLYISFEKNSSRIAYIGNDGYWYTSSSELLKHSIQDKNNNDVLNRILKLKIKSFIYNHDENKKITMGLVINNELYNLFPNIINSNVLDKERKNFNDFSDDEKKQMGISYNTLLLYFIMAFQEAFKKQHNFNEKIIQNLKELSQHTSDQDDQILNILKMKKSESYSNLLNNSYDSAIWDLIKNNELLNKKNEILKNQLNTLEIKYNWMENQYTQMAKSYDELYIEIKNLKETLNNKEDKQKTSSLFKKSATLKK